MLFVRLASCNYRCTWCDTDFRRNRTLSAEDIVSEALDLHLGSLDAELATCEDGGYKRVVPHVCLTGGEPTIHDLRPLISELRSAGCRIHLETNGSAPRTLMGSLSSVAYITASPKLPDGGAVSGGAWWAHQLKLVWWAGRGGCLNDFSLVWPGNYPEWAPHFPVKCLQPADEKDFAMNSKNLEAVLAKVKGDPTWSVSLQTQKLLGVR
jgi:organic radical activating enzyme